MKNTNVYARNLMVATNRAAKITGVNAADLRKHYRNFTGAPAELKHGLIIAYRIMDNYGAKAPAVAVEPATEQ